MGNKTDKTLKNKLKEIAVVICVSYTVISVLIAIINTIGHVETNNFNTVLVLICTTIAVSVLYMYELFSSLSLLLTITIQYVLATGLTMLVMYVMSFIDPVSPGGYRDLFISFTAIYILGAIVFYIMTYLDTKKMNKLLSEIQNNE